MKKQQYIRIFVLDAKLLASDINCLGISTQRSTFITWNRETGKTLHNFITWKDLRADALVKKWNSSYILKVLLIKTRFSNIKHKFLFNLL